MLIQNDGLIKGVCGKPVERNQIFCTSHPCEK